MKLAVAAVPLLLAAIGCATDSHGRRDVALRVAGMTKAEGLTWLDWPNRVQEALEALPGVLNLRVALDDDRFDLTYDPDRVTVDRMLDTVRALGYEPEVAVPRSVLRERIELPPSVLARLDDARRAGRLLLLEFSGAGWAACERMDAVTYSDEAVKRELANWTFAKVDLAAESEAARALRVAAVPTVVALDADGREVGRVEGFVQAAEFVGRLESLRAVRKE